MKRIEVFYYCYIPPDMRACSWTWFIDQQLGVIKNSNLHDFAKINVFINMPAHWTSIGDKISFLKNNPTSYAEVIPFYEKIREYIEYRYPFVSFLKFRDISEPNIYEGFPLSFLYEECLKKEIYVLYFHAKGSSRSEASVSNWREILNHKLVFEWRNCLAHLVDNDVIGLDDHMTTSGGGIVSGNFFWSKSSYVRSLNNPLDTESYVSEDFRKNQTPIRYAYEKWILSKKPSVYWVGNTNTDHYGSYCFLENFLICSKK